MQKILSLLFIFTCVTAIAQDEEPIVYDPNLIGDWELYASIKTNHAGIGIDTIYINLDSLYWNSVIRIEPDSAQELMIPTARQEDGRMLEEKCRWSLDQQGTRLWISIPCSQNIGVGSEIILISEHEFHIWINHDRGNWLIKFRRIDFDKK